MLADFYIKRGDTERPIVITAENDDGTPVEEDFTDAVVEFHMMTAAGVILVPAGGGSVVGDPADHRLGYQWVDGDTDEACPDEDTPHQAEFEVTLKTGRVMTFPNASNLNIHIFPDIA